MWAFICILASSFTNEKEFIFLIFFFWPGRTACGILVPRPGIEPKPSVVKVQSRNHWTAKEFPKGMYFSTR